MAPSKLVKQTIFAETVPCKELLEEVLVKLQHVPKATVASRQLAVIIGHLEIWQKRYMPDLNVAIGPTSEMPYTREQVDIVLSIYRKDGYFGLDNDQKAVLEWFDENYVKNKPN